MMGGIGSWVKDLGPGGSWVRELGQGGSWVRELCQGVGSREFGVVEETLRSSRHDVFPSF